ncbi:MAG TPA: PilZ domain-containing protein [Anaerolineales bacterium]
MSDKRKVERKNLMAFTPVYGLHPRTLLGYIEDLNVLGAMVISEKSMEVNTQLTLEIQFPDDVPELSNPKMRVPARVAWCKDENNHRYFDIGFQFTELKPEDEKIIEAILKRYEFRREIPHSKVE